MSHRIAGRRSPSINDLASAVVDNGRRGMPKPGCDCVQCFGYCIINEDQALRDRALKFDARSRETFPLEEVVA